MKINCFYIFQFQLPVPIFISHIWLTLRRNEILTDPAKGNHIVITSNHIQHSAHAAYVTPF